MPSILITALLLLALVLILSRFHPAATQRITGRLYAVRSGLANFYALETESGGVVLFDCGMNAALAARSLKKIGVQPDAVTHIFFTHTDYDHTGGVAAFKNAALYISKAEERMIDGSTARRAFLYNGKLPTYVTMGDGETITVGGATIRLHLAPGHTPGSSVYIVDGNNDDSGHSAVSGYIAVTGDLIIMSSDGTVTPFTRFMNMDHSQIIRSVEATRDLIDNAGYILTAHSGFRVNNK